MQKQTRLKFIKLQSYLAPAIACLLVSVSLQANAQSAEQILERMRQEYENAIQDIDNYTIISDEDTTRFVKAYDNGRPYFEIDFEAREEVDEMQAASAATSTDLFRPEVYSRLREEARLKGREMLGDHRTYVLTIDELDGFMDEAGVEGTMKDIKMHIDADDWVLRRIEFTADTMVEGRRANIDILSELKDIREIEGLRVPFNTVTTIRGLSDMLSEEELQRARQGMRELERQLERMEPQQRQMVEQMMEQQMRQYRQVIEGDEMKVTRQVQEVKVNTE